MIVTLAEVLLLSTELSHQLRIEITNAMKNYKILTLGASGAGKTVFLASMFKSLSIQREHGLYHEVEDDQKRKILNTINIFFLLLGRCP